MNRPFTQIEKVIPGKHGRPILYDLTFRSNGKPKPILIFCHGYKGFKDWGTFSRIAKWFADKGYIFYKFNFSFNGTTPKKPTEFTDLEAFGKNTFSIELDDLDEIISLAQSDADVPEADVNRNEIYLVGHSRGGGIAILKASEDHRVQKLVTWAAVNEFGRRWHGDFLEKWRSEGVRYEENKRTNQKMPLYFSLYEDYIGNRSKLYIPDAVKHMKIPFMAIHGMDDEAVDFEQAMEMKSWNVRIKLDLIPGATHTFGGKHPWNEPLLPEDLLLVLDHTDKFLKSES